METRDKRVLYFLIEVDEGGHRGQANTDALKAVEASSGGCWCWLAAAAAADACRHMHSRSAAACAA